MIEDHSVNSATCIEDKKKRLVMDVFSNKTTKTSALIFKEFSLCQANKYISITFKMVKSMEKK